MRDLRRHLTPGNVFTAAVLLCGLPLIAYRFVAGLGAVTNLSQRTPWGLWIGLDILCGIALAAGGYTLASAVHLFGLEKYRPVVRPAVLTGFLGYVFAVAGLLCDLGLPWRLPYPILWPRGFTSIMFEVGWCVCLYLVVLFLEFSPALLETLGLPRLRRRALDLTVGLSAAAVALSTLHQSSLGALFLVAPDRLHPLWWSPLLPVVFFVSSVVAGLSMVVLEQALSHRAFDAPPSDLDGLTLGLGQGAAAALYALFFLRLQAAAASSGWTYAATPLGAVFAVEVVGLVLLPCLLMARAVHERSARGVRVAALLAVLGVVMNRLDVSIVAFDWNAPVRYLPSVAELLISLTIITIGVQTFAFLVRRLPILGPHPAFAEAE